MRAAPTGYSVDALGNPTAEPPMTSPPASLNRKSGVPQRSTPAPRSSSAIPTIVLDAPKVNRIQAAAPEVLIHSAVKRSTALVPTFPPETVLVVIVAPAAASSSSPKPSP